MTPGPSTPPDPMGRFGEFVERLRWTIVDWLDRKGNRDGWGPLGILVWNYLSRTHHRLVALHARFVAGKSVAARQRPASRPAAEREALTLRERPPGIPTGAVFARFGAGYLHAWLLEVVEHPDMRALLAASPQAGRLLRPLWRRRVTYPLPEVLRLPPAPRRSRQPLAAVVLAEAPPDDWAQASPPQASPSHASPHASHGRRRTAPAKRKQPCSLFSRPPPFSLA